MFKASTFLIMLCIIGQPVLGQIGNNNPNLQDLPIVLSWDENGIRITPKTDGFRTANLLRMTPSQHLEQIGNDLIQVSLGTENTPVIIDMTELFKSALPVSASTDDQSYYPNARSQIDIHMPRLALANYNEPNSFILELKNFSNRTNNPRQIFLFRGLDVFNVITDNCAEKNAEHNRVTIDVKKCEVKHLILKGGLLALANVEDKIPDLCRKYNERYFSFGEPDAFVCLEECKDEDPNAKENLMHSRSLITKYNITDFEDEPISFLGDMLLTKKGVGLNIKNEALEDANGKTRNRERNKSYEPYDEFRFFPWYEFINLTFNKYMDEKQLMIEDPYGNSYIYNSDVYFSNVELIQFFNELRTLISSETIVSR